MSNKIRVLVLDTGINGLGILRALHKFSELDIAAVNFNKKDAGSYTRLARILKWQDPVNHTDEFQSRLYDLSKNYYKTILIPTRDSEVDILAELSNSLPENLLYYRNPITTVKALTDKSLATGTATRAGLNIPRTEIISAKMKPQPAGFRFPVIIKPYGTNSSQTPFKNFVAHNEEEFQNILRDHNDLLSLSIIQEFVPGGDDQIYQCNLLLNHSKDIIGVVEFQKLRQYLPQQGVTSYGQATLSERMVSLCQQLAEEADYKGLMSVEFKMDSETKCLVYIEVNLRLPIYNAVFPAAGVNLAHLYAMSLLKKVHHPVFAKRTATWMDEENDLTNIVTRKVQTPLRVWCLQLIKANSFAYWNLKDPLPFLSVLNRLLVARFKKVLHFRSLTSIWRTLCAYFQRIKLKHS